MKKILTIKVILEKTLEVAGSESTARMILFSGECRSDIFHGKILEGGVDTQQIDKEENGVLSARYILEGRDGRGKRCRLFIENNGEVIRGEIQKTRPRIITDSENLKWLEHASLYGTITSEDGFVLIHIYEE